MSTDAGKLRSALLEWLKRHPGPDFFELHSNGDLYKFLTAERGLVIAWPDVGAVRAAIHQLYYEGIIVPGRPGAKSGDAWALGHYFLSEHGGKVVNSTDYEPHDSEGYLARLRRDVATPDVVAVAYLSEALQGFRSRLHLSAAGMLGGAAERALLETIESLKAPLGAKFAKDVDHVFWVSQKRDVLSKALAVVGGLPKELEDRVKFALNGAIEAIRFVRNDVGHPKSTTMDRDLVHGHLVIFPTCYKTFRELLAHFGAPVKTLPVA